MATTDPRIERTESAPTGQVALLAEGVLDAELAALLTVLAEHGVPLVVAGRSAPAAEAVHGVLAAGRGGGVLLADSLDEVVRLAGARAAGELPDELRELGVLVVVRIVEGRPRIVAAHYVRPLERDAGGHVQRRGPAVLATFDERSGGWEHFAWAVTAELAERAGLERHAFEDEVEGRRAELAAAARDDGATAR